jgi:micrococcal nuclease
MRGCKVRKLAVLITLGALVALLVKKLRGDPAPQFANHPTVRGGPLPDLVPAPTDPTVPDPADAATALVPAPEDPTVPAPAPHAEAEPATAAEAEPDPEPATAAEAEPDPEPATSTEAEPEPEPSPTAPAELDLPPLVPAPDDPTAPATAGTALVAETADPTVPTGEPSWVAPVDGTCPDGYPIKAKVKSGIYHQPGGLAYDRTNPDRCYPDAAAAEADGLRAAKR